MSDSAPLPELLTAEVTREQALEHLHALRESARDFEIRMATECDTAPRSVDFATLEASLADGALVRAMIRMLASGQAVVDSFLRMKGGYRIVRLHPGPNAR